MHKVSYCMLTNTYDWDNPHRLAGKAGAQRKWVDSHAAPIYQGFYQFLNVGQRVSQTLFHPAHAEHEQLMGWGTNVEAT